MTAINRTAYPRLDARLNQAELNARYTLNETDHTFIRASTRGEWGHLTMAMLLKTRQDFGCFPAPEEMHMDTATHLASQLGLIAPAWPGEALGTKTLYRYQSAVRAHLGVTVYGAAAEELVTAASLKAELTSLAEQVDSGFPTNSELSVDRDGAPHLKQLATSIQPKGLAEFERELRARMPERHLLDILKHTEHWSGYTRHFGPPSGSDSKLGNATQRYLFAVFGYGCNLGPAQTARHAPEIATAQVLRRINAQHVNTDKLEAAMVDLIGQLILAF